MKISKEARTGALVLAAIVIFFVGFYFLKGTNVFSGNYQYYGWYESVQGLQPSAAVQIKGVNIGKVSEVKLVEGKVRVTLSIPKKTKIPKGTVARMISLDLLGTKAIRLELSNSNEVAEDDETINTAVESGIIDNLSSEISPLIKDVRKVVVILDSVLVGVDNMLNENTRQNLNQSIASLNITMQNFSELSSKLNRESGTLTSAIENVNSVTNNLAKNNDNINHIISNADAVTSQLKNAPIDQTVKELQGTAAQLNALLTKINNGDGTAGMIVNDKQLYGNLTQTLGTMQSLIGDIQSHPSKYINITIFGRKRH